MMLHSHTTHAVAHPPRVLVVSENPERLSILSDVLSKNVEFPSSVITLSAPDRLKETIGRQKPDLVVVSGAQSIAAATRQMEHRDDLPLIFVDDYRPHRTDYINPPKGQDAKSVTRFKIQKLRKRAKLAHTGPLPTRTYGLRSIIDIALASTGKELPTLVHRTMSHVDESQTTRQLRRNLEAFAL